MSVFYDVPFFRGEAVFLFHPTVLILPGHNDLNKANLKYPLSDYFKIYSTMKKKDCPAAASFSQE
jgi:hypothetical protein